MVESERQSEGEKSELCKLHESKILCVQMQRKQAKRALPFVAMKAVKDWSCTGITNTSCGDYSYCS
jgi:hypothetical protein